MPSRACMQMGQRVSRGGCMRMVVHTGGVGVAGGHAHIEGGLACVEGGRAYIEGGCAYVEGGHACGWVGCMRIGGLHADK